MQVQGKWQLIVVSHTHWDREWYLPFQAFRVRLVGLMDQLLDLLDCDPGYKHFMLDGQTIALEDYLEVRPDRRADIERHVRAGRLLIGPWYAQPDEFLPGGEALIRNLLLGHRVARQFGAVMKAGYVPDPFGHIAHLPAILQGFGIQDALFYRGTDASVSTTEFFWRAPDGSEVLTVYMPDGYAIANGLPLDREELTGRLRSIRHALEPWATTRLLLLMNGFDHTSAQPELPQIIAAANASLDDAELVHGTLPMLFSALREEEASWPRHQGEFRSGQRAPVLPGVLSTRMWIKQRNQQCEELLTRWAEPFSVWAALLRKRVGGAWQEPPLPAGPRSPYPSHEASTAGLLDRAWRHLLENHPHDSICGCSVDPVHEQMRTRFDWCEEIGKEITRQALRRISSLTPDGEGRGVVVFNPVAGPRTDFATAVVPRREDGEPVAMVDSSGHRVPCQMLEPALTDLPGWLTGLYEGLGEDRVPVGFMAADVPGFGYKTFRLEYSRLSRPEEGLLGGDRRIENEFFAVTVNPADGTLEVQDKRTGRVLEGLHRFVDGGDAGDEYNHCPPQRDELVERPAAPPVVRVLERGPARCTLEISVRYSLPARLSPGQDARSDERVDCPIITRVSLYPGVPRIDIRTEVENRAQDHRLRVRYPSGVHSDVTHAEQHFGVVTRPIALPEADQGWVEDPVGTYPQKAFVDVNDGRFGLLLANRGLPEYEAFQGPEGVTLALTLLRCVGWLSRVSLPCRRNIAGPPLPTPGAQCPGRHMFEYALVPHEGGWEQAYREAHRFAVPMRARWNHEGSGLLPSQASLLEVSSRAFVVSALKRAEGGSVVVVRLYNILSRPARGRMRLKEPHAGASMVNMDEQPLGEAPVRDGWVELRARPNQILNIKFETP
ncbi:MAG: glycoside hydrolase family 38 C-terminal domain-containing protein [Dehalococcoidia bacterium]